MEEGKAYYWSQQSNLVKQRFGLERNRKQKERHRKEEGAAWFWGRGRSPRLSRRW